MLNEQCFHLIFVDCDTTETNDGYQIAKEIRKKPGKNQHISIIGLGRDDKKLSRKWLEASMDEYYQKSISLRKLNDIIRRNLKDKAEMID